MNPEILPILSNALERASVSDKMSHPPQNSSASEQKTSWNCRRASAYKTCTEDKLADGGDLLRGKNVEVGYTQFEQLYALTAQELRELWLEHIGTEAEQYMQKHELIEELAYVLQEKELGGLSDEAQKRLDVFEGRLEKGQPLLCEKVLLAVGTILTREYNGRKHVVKILEDERVEYKGKVYTSLSAVAREIAGVRWNGRKFFHVEESKG